MKYLCVQQFHKKSTSIFIRFIFLFSCGIFKQNENGKISDCKLKIPQGFPTPLIPEGNELTGTRVATLKEVIADYKTGGVVHKNKSEKLKPPGQSGLNLIRL